MIIFIINDDREEDEHYVLMNRAHQRNIGSTNRKKND